MGKKLIKSSIKTLRALKESGVTDNLTKFPVNRFDIKEAKSHNNMATNNTPNDWTVVLSDYMVDPELVAMQTDRLLTASQASQDDMAASLAAEWDDSLHIR